MTNQNSYRNIFIKYKLILKILSICIFILLYQSCTVHKLETDKIINNEKLEQYKMKKNKPIIGIVNASSQGIDLSNILIDKMNDTELFQKIYNTYRLDNPNCKYTVDARFFVGKSREKEKIYLIPGYLGYASFGILFLFGVPKPYSKDYPLEADFDLYKDGKLIKTLTYKDEVALTQHIQKQSDNSEIYNDLFDEIIDAFSKDLIKLDYSKNKK